MITAKVAHSHPRENAGSEGIPSEKCNGEREPCSVCFMPVAFNAFYVLIALFDVLRYFTQSELKDMFKLDDPSFSHTQRYLSSRHPVAKGSDERFQMQVAEVESLGASVLGVRQLGMFRSA